ncbi:MAG TPA: undecaprenyl-diphosphate phosphatase [Gemmataceae bacterium]|nr:undecaprenyl-diphosphate phosphatase [Gemmataceae bacterium]
MQDFWIAVLVGIVEGITEFLPISSTGHMLLVEQALGLELATDEFWKLFTIVIQFGAILAVVVYYGSRLRELTADFLAPRRLLADESAAGAAKCRVPRWRHPLVLVLAAVIPAGLVGVIFKKPIDRLMEHALPIGLALIAGAVLIEVIERLCQGRGWVEDISGVSPGQALGIGVAQIASLVPGVSRSASTIMGGMLVGLRLKAAADFSFLLSIPTMAAAALYSLVKTRAAMDLHRWLVLAVGFVTAFVVAYVVVAWFLHYVRSHSFRLFVVYRIVLGLAVIAAWYCGWLH